jgi:hypothetical protein
MFGNRSRQQRPGRSDPVSSAGSFCLIFGTIAFVGPTFLHTSWIFTSWLGGMQAPVGLGLIVVGAVLTGTGFIRGRVTGTDIPPAPMDPSVPLPPPGPVQAEIGGRGGPGGIQPTVPPAIVPATPLGAGIDAPPPPLEPLYRPPTSLSDLDPPAPG